MKRVSILLSIATALFIFAMSISAAPPSRTDAKSPTVQKQTRTPVQTCVVSKDAVILDSAIVDEIAVGNYAAIDHSTVERLDVARTIVHAIEGHPRGVEHVPLY